MHRVKNWPKVSQLLSGKLEPRHRTLKTMLPGTEVQDIAWSLESHTPGPAHGHSTLEGAALAKGKGISPS